MSAQLRASPLIGRRRTSRSPVSIHCDHRDRVELVGDRRRILCRRVGSAGGRQLGRAGSSAAAASSAGSERPLRAGPRPAGPLRPRRSSSFRRQSSAGGSSAGACSASRGWRGRSQCAARRLLVSAAALCLFDSASAAPASAIREVFQSPLGSEVDCGTRDPRSACGHEPLLSVSRRAAASGKERGAVAGAPQDWWIRPS
jgi:hypothetical protein